ncbi:hypothetical protein D3C80_1507820 [compost metagenome]
MMLFCFVGWHVESTYDWCVYFFVYGVPYPKSLSTPVGAQCGPWKMCAQFFEDETEQHVHLSWTGHQVDSHLYSVYM